MNIVVSKRRCTKREKTLFFYFVFFFFLDQCLFLSHFMSRLFWVNIRPLPSRPLHRAPSSVAPAAAIIIHVITDIKAKKRRGLLATQRQHGTPYFPSFYSSFAHRFTAFLTCPPSPLLLQTCH